MQRHHEDDLSEIIEVAHRAYGHRLVPGASGNVSVRSHDDTDSEFLISASGTCLGYLAPEQLVPFPTGGTEARQPSSEAKLHAALYRALPRARALLHYHGTWTILAAEACEAEHEWRPSLALPEFTAFAPGRVVGVVPAVAAGSYELALQAASLARRFCASGLILRGHGGITWGPSPQQALFHAETLESAAKMDYLIRCRKEIH